MTAEERNIAHGVRLLTRTYFSRRHLSASGLFASMAYDAESSGSGPLQGLEAVTHKSAVVGAVVLAAAFLEALVNELFTDAAHGYKQHIEGLPKKALDELAAQWAVEETRRLPIMQKYETAAEALGLPALERGREPYQSAKLATQLRNAVIHYEPETIPGESTRNHDETHRFEQRLRGRFADHARVSAGNPWYPDKCFGAGCAQWTITVSRRFALDFLATAQLTGLYREISLIDVEVRNGAA